MTLIITVAVFIAVLCFIEGIFLFLRSRFDKEERRIKNRLKLLSDESVRNRSSDITLNRPLSAIPWLNNLLSKIPLLQRLDIILIQSNLNQPLGFFVLLSLVLALAGFSLGHALIRFYLLSIVSGIISGTFPFFLILMKKRQRVKKFERQLPEALDLMARSLKAGHALSTGLRMVAQEFDDPVGTEFHKTQTQIGLGVSTEQALKAMTERIDCPDLKFFSVSVIIQRETGGNLAEILENISNLIRSRFRLRGRIRALSAEGRLSAMILLGIPFCIAFVLWFINPSYIKVLVEDPVGRKLMFFALFMMAIGMFIIRKLIDVKV